MLNERAAEGEEEEEPVVESAALCVEGSSVLSRADQFCECGASLTPTIYLKNRQKCDYLNHLIAWVI